MKGMIYKEITLSKKQSILTGSIFAMFSILCILIRLSMECGNIANDPEVRGHLIDNIWVLRYSPLVVLAFLYNPSNTMYEDLDSGFLRFCRTTSLDMKKLIGAKMVTLMLFEMGAFTIHVIYLSILSAADGDTLSYTLMLISLKITIFSQLYFC